MRVGRQVKRKQTQEGGQERGGGVGASVPNLEEGGPGERTLTALQMDGLCRCAEETRRGHAGPPRISDSSVRGGWSEGF